MNKIFKRYDMYDLKKEIWTMVYPELYANTAEKMFGVIKPILPNESIARLFEEWNKL